MRTTTKQKNSGFTIIEMMVALALFTIVMTIATGSFLSLIGASSQLQGEQTVMTSMSFALDNMTREIRTGIHYYCWNDAAGNDPDWTVKDCPGGAKEFSFVDTSSQKRVSYSFENDELVRRKEGNDTPESILSSDVKLESVKFYVTGSKPLSEGTNIEQPTVTIQIKAQDPADSSGTTYILETTVTQRELDI